MMGERTIIATTDAYLISRRQPKKVEMLFAHLKRIQLLKPYSSQTHKR